MPKVLRGKKTGKDPVIRIVSTNYLIHLGEQCDLWVKTGSMLRHWIQWVRQNPVVYVSPREPIVIYISRKQPVQHTFKINFDAVL